MSNRLEAGPSWSESDPSDHRMMRVLDCLTGCPSGPCTHLHRMVCSTWWRSVSAFRRSISFGFSLDSPSSSPSTTGSAGSMYVAWEYGVDSCMICLGSRIVYRCEVGRTRGQRKLARDGRPDR